MTLAVDLGLLRQELSDHIVEGTQERYPLDWPGKRAAAFAAEVAPIAKTLRPVREESVGFDTTKNVFIEGDNLDALKLLQESYLSKVKVIYIDPPYNTGNGFVYEDDFAETSAHYLTRWGQMSATGDRLVANTEAIGRFHSDWLSMMYLRLKLAKNLLTDDRVLVVSIDENEHASLVRLGEEVLGGASYVGEIVLKHSSKNDQAYVSIQHEYILFFVKNRQANTDDWVENKEDLDKIYPRSKDSGGSTGTTGRPSTPTRGPGTSSSLRAIRCRAASTTSGWTREGCTSRTTQDQTTASTSMTSRIP